MDEQAATQERLVRYVLKNMAPAGTLDRHGISAQVHDLIGLDDVQRSTRPFHAHRIAGTSQNIARKAQVRAGYQPHRHFEDLLSVANLMKYRDRQRAAELTECLRAIDI
jgi:hypothetical protein